MKGNQVLSSSDQAIQLRISVAWEMMSQYDSDVFDLHSLIPCIRPSTARKSGWVLAPSAWIPILPLLPPEHLYGPPDSARIVYYMELSST